MARTLPPDLPARARIVVEQRDARALARRRLRGVQARRPGADHDDVEVRSIVHRAVSITRPSRHSVWQASTCARPSIVTRHSWHTPMPHSAPRGSPVTERACRQRAADHERRGDGRAAANADDLPVDRHVKRSVSHRRCSIAKRAGEKGAAPSSAQSCSQHLRGEQPRRAERGRHARALHGRPRARRRRRIRRAGPISGKPSGDAARKPVHARIAVERRQVRQIACGARSIARARSSRRRGRACRTGATSRSAIARSAAAAR